MGRSCTHVKHQNLVLNYMLTWWRQILYCMSNPQKNITNFWHTVQAPPFTLCSSYWFLWFNYSILTSLLSRDLLSAVHSVQCRRACRCHADAAFLEIAAVAAALTHVHTSAAALQEHSASLPSTAFPRSGPHFVLGLKRHTKKEKENRKVRKCHFSITEYSLLTCYQQSTYPRVFANKMAIAPQNKSQTNK